jgi:hypothetical protein
MWSSVESNIQPSLTIGLPDIAVTLTRLDQCKHYLQVYNGLFVLFSWPSRQQKKTNDKRSDLEIKSKLLTSYVLKVHDYAQKGNKKE